MVKSFRVAGVVFLVFLAFATSAHGALINGSFEYWTQISGTPWYTWSGWTYTAKEPQPEQYFGLGGSGSPPQPREGEYFAVLTPGRGVATELSQEVTMGIGDQLSGWANFDQIANGSGQFAYVHIYNGTNLIDTPWEALVDSGWVNWDFNANSAGTFKLVLGVWEPGDSTMNSVAYFDANVHTPVPLPTTLLLLGPGLIGLVCLRKKRRR